MNPVTQTMDEIAHTTTLFLTGWLLHLFSYDVATKALTLLGMVLYVVYLVYCIWCKHLERRQRSPAPLIGSAGDDDPENPTLTA